MSAESEQREQEIALALKQLVTDHQQGRLSMSAYRSLRHRLLDMAAAGTSLSATSDDKKQLPRPGFVVWIAVTGIMFLLLLLGWLLK
ncbi:MAG: hypothetical protein KJO35_06915 [Gammaproteobacteria bacterium]|nr:hypothetical protein [Gammaproteobacteria bacterium]NND60212.1 hypothetical protein [Gammaproteobacteria bacterium]